jgi:hypothetical protein
MVDAGFARRYAIFQRDMVYGESAAFETALTAVTALAEGVEAVEDHLP